MIAICTFCAASAALRPFSAWRQRTLEKPPFRRCVQPQFLKRRCVWLFCAASGGTFESGAATSLANDCEMLDVSVLPDIWPLSASLHCVGATHEAAPTGNLGKQETPENSYEILPVRLIDKHLLENGSLPGPFTTFTCFAEWPRKNTEKKTTVAFCTIPYYTVPHNTSTRLLHYTMERGLLFAYFCVGANMHRLGNAGSRRRVEAHGRTTA